MKRTVLVTVAAMFLVAAAVTAVRWSGVTLLNPAAVWGVRRDEERARAAESEKNRGTDA